ncbi:hypothetical protein AM452_18990 [Enterobacter cloacae]|nr:hypothetical protein AM452_18990 [Enterobacter cloacae]
MPENPASYRVVRTKSYLFNKAPAVEGSATAIEELKHCINANQTLGLMKGDNLIRHGWFIFQWNNSWW